MIVNLGNSIVSVLVKRMRTQHCWQCGKVTQETRNSVLENLLRYNKEFAFLLQYLSANTRIYRCFDCSDNFNFRSITLKDIKWQ